MALRNTVLTFGSNPKYGSLENSIGVLNNLLISSIDIERLIFCVGDYFVFPGCCLLTEYH